MFCVNDKDLFTQSNYHFPNLIKLSNHVSLLVVFEFESLTMTDITMIAGVSTLLNSRRGYKGQVTRSINKLVAEADLSSGLFNRTQSMIKDWLNKIDDINNKIQSKCADEGLDIGDAIDKESDYFMNIHERLDTIENAVNNNSNNNSILSQSNDMNSLANAISSLQASSLVPKITCGKFSGKGNDRFEFKNFMQQFENCTANMKSESAKLAYLRTCLTDFPLQLISHLTINNDNYLVAINLLTSEFLDIPFIVDDIFKMLISAYPKYDPEFMEVKKYISKVRADLYDLFTTFKLDFLTPNTSGHILVSHIVFSKLPNIIKRELIHITKNNYPTVTQIFDNYMDVIKTLVKTSSRKPDSYHFKKEFKNKPDSSVKPKQALENFKTVNVKMTQPSAQFHCKFCAVEGHSMLKCTRYVGLEERQKRCLELSLCTLCTSSKHKSNDCFGKRNSLSYECKICKSKSHISALCDSKSLQSNLYINTGI